MAQHFGANSEVKGDPIWIIAARNNEKEVKRTYRIHGERCIREEFLMFRGK